jgi:hypothetical protein
MARGGSRHGAGRKRGAPNKKTAAVQEEVSASGETPLAYMLRVMRNSNSGPKRRDDMAKAAAPYVHAKLASVEHTGKDGGAIEVKVSDLELARRMAFLLHKGARALDKEA